jgi:hypothetical protein
MIAVEEHPVQHTGMKNAGISRPGSQESKARMKQEFCLLFCIGIKLSLLFQGKNIHYKSVKESRASWEVFDPTKDDVSEL